MTKKHNVHTLPNSNSPYKWVNKAEGTGKTLSQHKTKDAAEKAGRQQAKENQSEHIIHKKDGTISEKNSYGNDPCPPKDGEKNK